MSSSFVRGEWPDRRETAERLTESLLEWQAVGDPECFARIVEIVSPAVLCIADRTLLRSGLRSGSLRDDVLSLVLDHLCRLYAPTSTTHPVARFSPEPDGSAESGPRYICWLALARTRDVIRTQRRRRARQPSFTDLNLTFPGMAIRGGCPPPPSPDASEPLELLRAAIHSLDGDARQIVEMLLAGRSQKEIAKALGVCEGTVSRRKDLAFLQIRDFATTASLTSQSAKP